MPPFQRITTDLDFAGVGCQVSCLRVVQPRNDSAWHAVEVPAAVIGNGEGPTVLLTGGVHGDEFEGPIVLLKLLRRLRPERLRGRLILLPALNRPALDAGTRLSPLDDRDLNRAFPGDAGGTITSAIANFVETMLLPRVELVLDIHSGGRSMMFLPCLWMNHVADAGLMARSLAAARAFGAPVTLVTSPLAGGAMSDSAERLGKIYLSTEVAGAAAVSRDAVRLVEDGIDRLLVHLGLLAKADSGAARAKDTRFMSMPDDGCYLGTRSAGLLEPLLDLGEPACPGEAVAAIHSFESPEAPPIPVVARRAGTLVGRRALGYVRPGDAVAALAVDLPAA